MNAKKIYNDQVANWFNALDLAKIQYSVKDTEDGLMKEILVNETPICIFSKEGPSLDSIWIPETMLQEDYYKKDPSTGQYLIDPDTGKFIWDLSMMS